MPAMLKLLSHLTSRWEGEALGKFGLIRILNASGKKPPLIWCFNGAHEFPMLAQGLGSDQPVIGLRSLHMVTPNGPNRYVDDEQTAEMYAELLLSTDLDLSTCAVGGNCQGGGIAIPLATRLLRAGREVQTLILMETRLPTPFPRPVGFVYGDRSEMFNPYLQGEDIEPKWDRLCRKWTTEIIPGSHGEYFTPENSQTTCDAIGRLLEGGREQSTSEVEAQSPSLAPISLPKSVQTSSALNLEFIWSPAAIDPTPDEPLTLHSFWVSTTSGLIEAEGTPISPKPDSAGSLITVSLQAPDRAGDWDLRLFLCRAKSGPVEWRFYDQLHYPMCIL